MRSWAVVAVSIGCQAKFPEQAQGLKITETAFGIEHAKKTVPYSMPFELDASGSNGTSLVLAYLRNAEGAGARYASDLSIALQFSYQGKPMECISRVTIAPGPPALAPTPTETADPAGYTTTVTPWQPDYVKAKVTDRDLHCTKHGQHVVTREPDFENRFDVTVPRKLQPGYMPTTEVMNIVWTDECELVENNHIVRRYAHFIATKFTPPDWGAVAKQYSEWKLIEQPPECHTFQRLAGAPLEQSVRGTLHFTGETGKSKYPLSETHTDHNWTPCIDPHGC